ncbi:hypothetical protein CMQ_479 [Grosmannia clavigera kw1407]|uniref:Uncharacterized protein n=1 Tax=Grosmannia clavigera (strain kw1407 / UAMH 11150) TaxID=655863 RepID=F0XDJ2_GROCL|nr:uncharacterized protein CMQ_479 [Grosmannia clavigera kw1407]EFX03551.1 hypothetical protein CMQ_479 [Grosmannia clavigera kw1407]
MQTPQLLRTGCQFASDFTGEQTRAAHRQIVPIISSDMTAGRRIAQDSWRMLAGSGNEHHDWAAVLPQGVAWIDNRGRKLRMASRWPDFLFFFLRDQAAVDSAKAEPNASVWSVFREQDGAEKHRIIAYGSRSARMSDTDRFGEGSMPAGIQELPIEQRRRDRLLAHASIHSSSRHTRQARGCTQQQSGPMERVGARGGGLTS